MHAVAWPGARWSEDHYSVERRSFISSISGDARRFAHSGYGFYTLALNLAEDRC